MSRKEKSYHFIYKTTNLVNEKYYIGMHSTDNLNDGYVGSGKRLWYSINKYGKENFKLEILEFLSDRCLLKEREKVIVNPDLIKDEKCMNLRIGGEGGFSNEQQIINGKKGYERFKELNKSSEFNEWFRNRCKGHQKWIGKKHSLETIEKMKIPKNVGVKNPQYGTCWITNGIENKKIKNENLEIPNEWYKGRVLKNIEI